MEIREVKTRKEWKAFFTFPNELYACEENYIPPLIEEEKKQFDPRYNPALEFSDFSCWLVYDGRKVVGRIAGIINHRCNEIRQCRCARFSWFDLYNDAAIGALLLNTVESWAVHKGMTQIIGPYGFTSFNPHGILVEGFNERATPYSHYNFPYYQHIVEQLDYRKEMEWVESRVAVPDRIPEKMLRIAAFVKERYGAKVVDNSSMKNLLTYKYQIFHLLNDSYEQIYGFVPLTDKQIQLLVDDFEKILIPKYISVVVNPENEVIAFGVSIPDLARALRKAKGHLWPLGIFYLWHGLHHNDTIDLMLIAVRPDYQQKGVNALLFEQLIPIYQKNGIRYVETLQNQSDNQRVQSQWDYFDRRIHKRSFGYVKELM